MKTRQQIIQETILDILQDKQELNEFNAKRVAGLGALGLSIATAGQFAGSHVKPIQDFHQIKSSYNMPVDSNTLKAGLKQHGMSDLVPNVGNFEPHSKQTTTTRMPGVKQGEEIPHMVRGPLDFRTRIQHGAAAEELPTTEKLSVKRTSPLRGVETYTSKSREYSDGRESDLRSGKLRNDNMANFIGQTISTQSRFFDARGDHTASTPSIAGQSAVAGGLYGAGMLALGALRRRRSS